MYIQNGKKTITGTAFAKILFMFAGLAAGLLISRIFFQTYTVMDDSMLPNLKRGDRAIIFKAAAPGPGDVILINSPIENHKVLLKRLLAEGGDAVEIKDKIIYLNSAEFKFQWPVTLKDKRSFPENFTKRDNLPALKIDNGYCFVIGDNLDYSFDSRDFGPVKEEYIIGRVIFQY
jgi:signal peptidase I